MLYKITRKGKLCIIYIQKYYQWIPSVFEPQKPKYIQLLVSVSWKETRGWFTNGSLLCIFAIEIIIFYIWLYMLQETFNGCQHFLVIFIEKSISEVFANFLWWYIYIYIMLKLRLNQVCFYYPPNEIVLGTTSAPPPPLSPCGPEQRIAIPLRKK